MSGGSALISKDIKYVRLQVFSHAFKPSELWLSIYHHQDDDELLSSSHSRVEDGFAARIKNTCTV